MAQGAIGKAQAEMSRKQADLMEEMWKKSPAYKKQQAANKRKATKKTKKK